MKAFAKQLTVSTLAALALAAFAPSTASAEQHPAYRRALEDLRHARLCLARVVADPEVKWDEKRAIREIDEAVTVIKKAAIEEGKIPAIPPLDPKVDYRGRLNRALEMLRKAQLDVNQTEGSRSARDLQRRALEHIAAAIHFTEEGIADVREKR